MRIISIVALILLFFVFLEKKYPINKWNEYITSSNLKSLSFHIENFYWKNKRIPDGLLELRTYLKLKNINIPPYDSLGNRLIYLRLTEKYYILKSIFKDERIDSLFYSDDLAVYKLPEPISLKFNYDDNHAPYYPHLNLIAGSSSNGKYTANLMIDTQRNKRKILVRKNNNQKFLMVSYHDKVDEFLWIPNTLKLVYTVSADEFNSSKMFLWNLYTGEFKEISSSNSIDTLSSSKPKLHIFQSLYKIDPKKKKLFFFKKWSVNNKIDPVEFFSKNNLFEVQFKNNYQDFDIVDGDLPLSFGYGYQPINSGVELLNSTPNPLVLDWIELPSIGEASEIIEKWQKFSIKYNNSPFYPYSLWSLGGIYGEAFILYQLKEHPDANLLRKYGMEISRALTNLQTAPDYLKAFARFNYSALSSSKPLTYNVSKLSKSELNEK